MDLSAADITDSSSLSVADLLVSEVPLKSLNISRCAKLSTVGWEKVFKTLSENKYLETLTLDYNALNDDAIECLADALNENTTLKSLDLEGMYMVPVLLHV